MDGIREFLEKLRQAQLVAGEFLGLLHIVIGRRITRGDGTVVSTGITWRELANLLRNLRWDKDLVKELGLDPQALPPRDRVRYWYSAIAQAKVDSPAARESAARLAAKLVALDYHIGPPPKG